MNNIELKINILIESKTEKYKKQGCSHPESAAKFDVEGILNRYKNQTMHINQLLDEEIEDTRKAIKQLTEI